MFKLLMAIVKYYQRYAILVALACLSGISNCACGDNVLGSKRPNELPIECSTPSKQRCYTMPCNSSVHRVLGVLESTMASTLRSYHLKLQMGLDVTSSSSGPFSSTGPAPKTHSAVTTDLTPNHTTIHQNNLTTRRPFTLEDICIINIDQYMTNINYTLAYLNNALTNRNALVIHISYILEDLNYNIIHLITKTLEENIDKVDHPKVFIITQGIMNLPPILDCINLGYVFRFAQRSVLCVNLSSPRLFQMAWCVLQENAALQIIKFRDSVNKRKNKNAWPRHWQLPPIKLVFYRLVCDIEYTDTSSLITPRTLLSNVATPNNPIDNYSLITFSSKHRVMYHNIPWHLDCLANLANITNFKTMYDIWKIHRELVICGNINVKHLIVVLDIPLLLLHSCKELDDLIICEVYQVLWLMKYLNMVSLDKKNQINNWPEEESLAIYGTYVSTCMKSCLALNAHHLKQLFTTRLLKHKDYSCKIQVLQFYVINVPKSWTFNCQTVEAKAKTILRSMAPYLSKTNHLHNIKVVRVSSTA